MIAPAQRHTRRAPCPICEGSESDRRGRGERCHGFTSDDGKYAYCSREEYSGDLDQPTGPLRTYRHYLLSACRCGHDHSTGAPAPQMLPRAPRAVEAPKPPTRTHLRQKPDAIYAYRALETGAPLRKLRYGTGKGKWFTWQRPDGAGDWIDGRGDAVPDVYGADALADADPFEPLFITEGEKDRDKITERGGLAISPPDGAGSWRDEYSHYTRGRQVVTLEDKDEPGEKHTQDVAASIALDAATVRIVRFESHHDVGDWIDAGGTIAELRRLAAHAPIISAWQPSAQHSNPASQDDSPTQTQKTHCPNCKVWEDRARIAEASLTRLRKEDAMTTRIMALPKEQLSPALKPAAIAVRRLLNRTKARDADGMEQVYRAEVARRCGVSEQTAGTYMRDLAAAGIIRREVTKTFDMSEIRIAEGPLFEAPEQVETKPKTWGGKREKVCSSCGSNNLELRIVCRDCGTLQRAEDVNKPTDDAGDEPQQDAPPPSDISIVTDLASHDTSPADDHAPDELPADARAALLIPVRELAAEQNYPALRIAGGRVTLAPTPAAWDAFLTRADAEAICALLDALSETAATAAG